MIHERAFGWRFVLGEELGRRSPGVDHPEKPEATPCLCLFINW